MYRARSPGSTYVTAHALEALADAVEGEWEYILFIGTHDTVYLLMLAELNFS